MKPNQHQRYLVSDRREWLRSTACGMGMLGLASLTQQESALATSIANASTGRVHFPAKAKRIIQIFLEGGLSHMDTFDPKPELNKRAGQAIPSSEQLHDKNSKQELDPRSIAFGSPFAFQRYGESGLEISELFPKIAHHADKLCVVRSMHGDDPAHQQAMLLMNCGDTRLIRPSVGSWVTYGLGSENENLPSFVVLYHQGLPLKGAENWQSSFLPGNYQGTSIDIQYERVEQLLSNIDSVVTSRETQAEQLNLLHKLNRIHREEKRTSDGRLEARIQSYELAFRMQAEAMDTFDLASESQETRELYGENETGRQCMMARRLSEAGVRFVQLYCGSWDHHNEIESGIRSSAEGVDQAIAGLLTDLERRGMLEETLVLCTSEFGRTPTADTNAGAAGKAAGRDHNHRGFSLWMAGAGVKPGTTFGATDELGWKAIENPVHVHDLHATVLHLMGLDHTKLTYRYAGRDFRLTDVQGHVIQGVLS